MIHKIYFIKNYIFSRIYAEYILKLISFGNYNICYLHNAINKFNNYFLL